MLEQPQGYPGHQESKGKGQGKVLIGSSEGKNKEDPLEKFSRPSGLPALDKLLLEFQDVFPEDLPAETPLELEITPSNQGSKPPHQAPYQVPPGADATIMQTLEYLEEHGLVNLSLEVLCGL